MAELTISAPVGAPPADNLPDDVRTVQTLLQQVQPALRTPVAVTGTADRATLDAIREFQRRFMAVPDGRVDPDNRTLYHLNNHGAPNYAGCSPQQRRGIDRDMINAQKWLDLVLQKLASPTDADTKRKVRNVFHIDVDNPDHASRLQQLRENYRRVRAGFDAPFPIQCEPGSSLFAAWVDLNDPTGTMHFPRGHFAQSADQRTETIIHERSHTILNISHDGMSGAGQLDFGQAPDDDNGFTFEQAIRNAYCYGWLATALQPGYVPPAEDVIIVAPVHR
jgi:hypothetical protein